MTKKKKVKKLELIEIIYPASNIRDHLSNKFEVECDIFWELFFNKNEDTENDVYILYLNDFDFFSNFETKDYYNLIFSEFGEDENDLIIEKDI